MQKQNLILLRDFLFKMFIVSVIFAILLFIGTTLFWNIWASIIYTKFQVGEKELGELVVKFFINLRFFLIFLILTPAISLHWTIKSLKDTK